MNNNRNFNSFEEGGMDEFMRKAVDGHSVEPEPGLWKGISRTMLWRELLHFNFTNVSIKTRVAGGAGLLLLAVALYFLFHGSPSDISSASSPAVIPSRSAPVHPTAPSSAIPSGAGNHASNPVNIPHTGDGVPMRDIQNSPYTGTDANSVQYASNKPRQTAGAQTPAGYPGQDYSSGTAPQRSAPAQYPAGSGSPVVLLPDAGTTGISRVEPVETKLLPGNPYADTIITIRNFNGISSYLKTKQDAVRFFSASFGIVPEVSFYNTPESYSKLNVWANGGLTFHFSRFSLSTGIGLGYVYNQGSYKVEYKSNDSVGYFTSVVSYTVGTNNEIKYTTITKSVYDSLIHQDDYRTMNRYTYLQIPLLVGYRLAETGRVSLTLRAGPALSFLVSSRNSNTVIEYANARIIRTDDQTPSPMHSNWQMWGDLLIEIRMNKKTSIYFAPSCKYYLTPMADQENTSFKAPWSVGLGVGIQFNFAPKRNNP